MDKYLESSEFIDWHNPLVAEKARELSLGAAGPEEIAKSCFEYVRDQIKHSGDHELNPVTCKASDVLKHKTGYCYAKSHLLAALLRANGLPTGLCYQRLAVEDDRLQFCLHGLNAVYLADIGWYRIDPRGNKPGVESLFTPPAEKLPFSPTAKGELDLPEIWPQPLPQVIDLLTSTRTFQDVADNFPDIEIINT